VSVSLFVEKEIIMKRVFILMLLFVLIAVASHASMTTVTVTVRNESAFQNSFELFDNNANRSIGTITLAPHGSTKITLQSSQALDDGYGSFKSKKSDSGTWNNFSLLRNGESVTL
jgi:hypothetical protein